MSYASTYMTEHISFDSRVSKNCFFYDCLNVSNTPLPMVTLTSEVHSLAVARILTSTIGIYISLILVYLAFLKVWSELYSDTMCQFVCLMFLTEK